jgi:PIN domain nuclease of toxin-antitoxin system
MANKYVVDTHALIWFLEGNPKLGSNARMVLNDPQAKLILPTIALAEAIDIVTKGRTSIPDVTTLMNDVLTDARIELQPLTLAILQQSLTATAVPEMHDRLIVSTALWLESLGQQVALLTTDHQIIAAALVHLVW